MKKIKFLLFGIVSILGIGLSSASLVVDGVTYPDGIYRNESRRLISVVYNDDYFTLQDRNLGASVVYNSGDVLTNENVGKFYQRGNNYGFYWSGVRNVTLIKVDGTDYGPNNYYNHDYFYSNNSDQSRLSVYNSNLRGDSTNTYSARQGPCPYGYYIPTTGDFGKLIDSYVSFYGDTNNLYGVFKIPLAGWISIRNENNGIGSDAVFWSSTPYNSTNSNSFAVQPIASWVSYDYLTYGNQIRCFKSTSVLPDNSFVTIYGGNTELFPDPVPDDPSTGGQSSWQSPIDGGVFDFNTFVIEKAVICYMSSGSYGGIYGDCTGINYTGFIDQYSPTYSSWQTNPYYGSLSFNNAKPILENYCYNVNTVEYPFCSQLDIYDGADLLYVYENGILNFYALGSGFGVDFGSLGSGQLGELTCTGVWCNNISQGLPEYIIPISSGDDFVITGEILDKSWFLNFIDNHSFFSCPYSYSGSYFVLGKDLINRLGGRDLMIPINCFIAGFSAGQKVFFFGDPNQGAYWSGSLINGDTLSHKRLYTFFDLVLSMGLLLLGLKLFSHMTGRH